MWSEPVSFGGRVAVHVVVIDASVAAVLAGMLSVIEVLMHVVDKVVFRLSLVAH